MTKQTDFIITKQLFSSADTFMFFPIQFLVLIIAVIHLLTFGTSLLGNGIAVSTAFGRCVIMKVKFAEQCN